MTAAYTTGRAVALIKLGISKEEARTFISEAGGRINDISIGYTLHDLLRGDTDAAKQEGLQRARVPTPPKPPLVLPWLKKPRNTAWETLLDQHNTLNTAAGYPSGGRDAF